MDPRVRALLSRIVWTKPNWPRISRVRTPFFFPFYPYRCVSACLRPSGRSYSASLRWAHSNFIPEICPGPPVLGTPLRGIRRTWRGLSRTVAPVVGDYLPALCDGSMGGATPSCMRLLNFPFKCLINIPIISIADHHNI